VGQSKCTDVVVTVSCVSYLQIGMYNCAGHFLNGQYRFCQESLSRSERLGSLHGDQLGFHDVHFGF